MLTYNQELDELTKRKTTAVMANWKNLHSSYRAHASQVSMMRGWTITLLLAYFGFGIQQQWFDSILLIVPAYMIIVAFFILESVERVNMYFLVEILKDTEEIFMLEDRLSFGARIRTYQFLVAQYAAFNSSVRMRAPMFVRSLADFTVVFWYSFLVVSVLLVYWSVV